LLPKILAAPNRRSLATPGWVQTNLSFSSGRHFYLSPLAMQKVTTPLTTTSDSTNVKIFTIYVARYTYYTVVIVCYFCRQSVVFSFSDSITLIALFQGGLAIMTSDGACCVGGRDHVTHLVDECQSWVVTDRRTNRPDSERLRYRTNERTNERTGRAHSTNVSQSVSDCLPTIGASLNDAASDQQSSSHSPSFDDIEINHQGQLVKVKVILPRLTNNHDIRQWQCVTYTGCK